MSNSLSPALVKFVLAALVSCPVIVVDIRRRRIPNALSLAILVIGILSAAAGRGWAGAADSCLGALLAFAVFLIPYLLGGMGGGDVKLMAGFGALTGVDGVVPALVLVAIAGAATSVLYLAFRRTGLGSRVDAIPYAPAIAIGGLLVTASQIGVRS